MQTLIAPIIVASFILVPITMATPAAAATINVTDATCSVNATGNPITGAPGDVISISTGLTGCRRVLVRKSLVDNDQLKVSVTGTGAVNFNGTDPTQYSWAVDVGQSLTSIDVTLGATLGVYSQGIIVQGSGGPPPATSWSVNIGSGGGGSSSNSQSPVEPAPVVQQFGRPASGTCASAASESLNWSGVASGGWGDSWAQWMNGGNGGAVCTRTLTYSTAQSRWVVR